jgi:hypothetical protein
MGLLFNEESVMNAVCYLSEEKDDYAMVGCTDQGCPRTTDRLRKNISEFSLNLFGLVIRVVAEVDETTRIDQLESSEIASNAFVRIERPRYTHVGDTRRSLENIVDGITKPSLETKLPDKLAKLRIRFQRSRQGLCLCFGAKNDRVIEKRCRNA